MEDEQFFAVALDGGQAAGPHGDLEPGPRAVLRHRRRRAGAHDVAQRLLAPDMFSGWGIRTHEQVGGRATTR